MGKQEWTAPCGMALICWLLTLQKDPFPALGELMSSDFGQPIPSRIFNQLPGIDSQSKLKLDGKIQALGSFLSSHGVADQLGFHLLHKHHDLLADEITVLSVNTTGTSATIVPRQVDNMLGHILVPNLWKYDTPSKTWQVMQYWSIEGHEEKAGSQMAKFHRIIGARGLWAGITSELARLDALDELGVALRLDGVFDLSEEEDAQDVHFLERSYGQSRVQTLRKTTPGDSLQASEGVDTVTHWYFKSDGNHKFGCTCVNHPIRCISTEDGHERDEGHGMHV